MDPSAAVNLLGGSARWCELKAHGVSRRAFERAISRGEIVLRGHGVVCLPGAELAPVTVALRLGAVLSCGAAAQHHGLEVFGTCGLHVARYSQARAPVPKMVVLHRRMVAADSRATHLLQTLLDCARCLPIDQAVSVLDSALRQGRVEIEELTGLVPTSGRYAATVGRVVASVDCAAQSVLESATRVLLLTSGLTQIQSQVEFDRVGWVDFVVRGWLVIEVDGYAVHRERFGQDRRRDAELTRRGFVVLRFTYDDVQQRPAWVLAVVQDALRAGRPPGGC